MIGSCEFSMFCPRSKWQEKVSPWSCRLNCSRWCDFSIVRFIFCQHWKLHITAQAGRQHSTPRSCQDRPNLACGQTPVRLALYMIPNKRSGILRIATSAFLRNCNHDLSSITFPEKHASFLTIAVGNCCGGSQVETRILFLVCKYRRQHWQTNKLKHRWLRRSSFSWITFMITIILDGIFFDKRSWHDQLPIIMYDSARMYRKGKPEISIQSTTKLTPSLKFLISPLQIETSVIGKWQLIWLLPTEKSCMNNNAPAETR